MTEGIQRAFSKIKSFHNRIKPCMVSGSSSLTYDIPISFKGTADNKQAVVDAISALLEGDAFLHLVSVFPNHLLVVAGLRQISGGIQSSSGIQSSRDCYEFVEC